MSEFETKTPGVTDRQLETLVAEVESKLLATEDAMSELRHSIRQLKAYRPASAPAGAWTSTVPAVAPSTPMPQAAEPARESVREDVSRIVAETRAEIDSSAEARPSLHQETVGVPFWTGPKKEEPPEKKDFVEDYGVDSTSEASWPVARAPHAAAEPPRVEPRAESRAEPVASDGDDDARREEVARIVAQMRDSGDVEEDTAAEAPDADDDSRRRDVARMVAELRGSVDLEADAPQEGEAGSNGYDEAAAEAEMHEVSAEIADGEDAGAGADEARREDVASMVAQMRAELQGGDAPADEAPAEEHEAADQDVRDEVRRAVEAARAEMATGYKDSEEDGGAKKFSFPDWQSAQIEPSGPPVIVIKDSEGRVELARVYETLSMVHCDENAALLNYTPHSVTVGLNARAPVPEMEALSHAIETVFGRACQVDSDGVRVNVQIGRDLKGKDSAA